MSTKNLYFAVAPHEHVRFCDSAVGLAGYLRGLLSEPRTLDELHALLSHENSGWPGKPSFTQISLAVALLYAIGAVAIVDEARIEARR